ncbi:MAG: porin [Candidatus Zixiibacteriota bacterium]
MKPLKLGLSLAVLTLGVIGRVNAQNADDSLKAVVDETRQQVEGMAENMAILTGDVEKLKQLKVSGYLQARYELNDSSRYGITGGYDATKNLNANNIYIRRGRIKFQFQPNASSRYIIYFDASKDKVSLKEAYVDLSHRFKEHAFTLTAGQFNIPFGYEIEYSSSKRDFPERSLTERTLFKGERDRGVNLSWTLPKNVQFNAAVLQGYGIEDSKFTWFDPTKQKDVLGRVKVKLGMVDFGVSAYHGKTYVPGTAAVAPVTTYIDVNGNGLVDAGDSVRTTTGSAATPAVEYDKNRVGIDAQLYLDVLPLGGTGVRAEMIGARDKGKMERGWYLWLSQAVYKNFGGAVRYDYFDPNTSDAAKSDATGTLSLAAHYYWDANVRLTAAYDMPRLLKDNSIFSKASGDKKDNTFTLQFQYSM